MLPTIIIALVLLAHGIGHSMGLLQVFHVATVNPQWHGESWILGSSEAAIVQPVAIVTWSLAIIGFALLAAVVMGWLPATWWVPLAVASAVVSLLGIALFPTAFPVFSTLGAIAVNAVLLIAVVVYRWAPTGLAA
jgi:hypothetical protein